MAKFLNLDDAQLAAEMQAKPARQVMAEFLYALTQLTCITRSCTT